MPAVLLAVAVVLVLGVLVGMHVPTGVQPHRAAQPSTMPDPGVPRAEGDPAAPSPSATPAAAPAAAAVAAGDALAAATPDATLAVAVLDRRTGQTAVGAAGAAPMYAASLTKIMVALDVLAMRRDGLPVLPADLGLIRRALGPSDDGAMNALWVRFDGNGAVARVASRLGLRETRPPTDPSQWGEALTSARDVVALYQHLLTELPAEDRDLLLGALAAAPPVATDGFDQAYGLLAGERGGPAVSKQGWMCCQGGRITLHSAGLPQSTGYYVVALLSSVPSAVGYDGAREMLTAAADAVRAPLT